MKVKVDKDTCIGCGMCEGICPKVFKMNSEGTADVTVENPDGEAKECAKEAADSCPVEAIIIEE
ncbi:MAG: ferredoxin [Candidatus Petromonas sp.]|jgi:ferredoxin|nr:ferredoxin [Candidatus Petromonas sp.]